MCPGSHRQSLGHQDMTWASPPTVGLLSLYPYTALYPHPRIDKEESQETSQEPHHTLWPQRATMYRTQKMKPILIDNLEGHLFLPQAFIEQHPPSTWCKR